MKNYIITWGNHIYRSDALSEKLQYKNIYVYLPKNLFFLGKYVRYCYSFFLTLFLVAKNKPKKIILVAPPTLILFCISPIKILFPFVIIYLDFHNGVLRREWKRIPFLKYAMKKADFIICHNECVKSKIEDTFDVKTYVLADPVLFNIGDIINNYNDKKNLKIIIPCSFADDEPIEYIDRLADYLSEVNYVSVNVTGNYKKKQEFIIDKKKIDSIYTGYISEEAYKNLLQQSDIVLCITSDDDIQMAAANEAITNNKVFFHSPTLTLCEIYDELGFSLSGDAKNDADLIVGSMDKLEAKFNNLIDFKKKYDIDWDKAAKKLKLLN